MERVVCLTSVPETHVAQISNQVAIHATLIDLQAIIAFLLQHLDSQRQATCGINLMYVGILSPSRGQRCLRIRAKRHLQRHEQVEVLALQAFQNGGVPECRAQRPWRANERASERDREGETKAVWNFWSFSFFSKKTPIEVGLKRNQKKNRHIHKFNWQFTVRGEHGRASRLSETYLPRRNLRLEQ